MTCIVELSMAVDVPVTVNIQLSDPAGSPLNTTTPSVSGSNYSSMSTISSFGRDESGNYTCMADITSSSLFFTNSDSKSTMVNFTVGEKGIFIVTCASYNVQCHIFCIHNMHRSVSAP